MKTHHWFDFNLGVKVTHNVSQYPLHYANYASAKFKVATNNDKGGYTITKNAFFDL